MSTSWGTWGSATVHQRYAEPIPPETLKRARGRNRRCGCRVDKDRWCQERKTHFGAANGVVLMSGCAWCVRVWMRDGGPRGI